MAERIVPPLVAEVGIELCRVKLEGGLLGGYRCEVITENLSEREKNIYKCPRCEGIMKDCSITKGEQLCACCIREEEESHSNVLVRITILSLKCSCPLTKRGCDWIGTLVNVETHLIVCQYVYVLCELMCGIVLRGEMIIHVRGQCLQREEPCFYCSRKRKVCEMGEHLKVCGKVELMCELGCEIRVRREDTLYHIENECSEETVMCPYVKYRCEVVGLKRKELRQHLEENRSLHTELKLNTLEEQIEMKLNALAENNQSLSSQIESLNVKLEMKDKEIQFLLEEVQYKQEGTMEWRIKHILKYFKPNQGNSFGADNFSRRLEIVMFPFQLSHTTDATHFNIYFHPIRPLEFRNPNKCHFVWHFKIIFFVRVICHTDLEHSLLYKSPIIKDNYSAETNKVCSIPLSTDLKDFIRSSCLDLEVKIRMFKNQDF